MRTGVSLAAAQTELSDYKPKPFLYRTFHVSPMRIHIIGDSHVNVFRDYPQERVVVHQLGPATAHNLIEDQSTTNSKKQLTEILQHIDKDDKVVLILGEIDCRTHIYKKHTETGTPISDLIDETVRRYVDATKPIIDMGIDFAIYSVLPAGRWCNPSNQWCPLDPRIQIHKEFHEKLSMECKIRGYKMVDVWDKIVDETGNHTQQKYLCDPVHLNGNAIPILIAEINRVFWGQP